MKRLAIFASGNGTNFEAIAKSIKDGNLNLELALLITDKKCFALERAEKLGIKAYYFNIKNYKNKEEFEKDILKLLIKEDIYYIALAGYMRMIGDTLIEAFPDRIVNIHPSLLPSFKGRDAILQAFSFGVKVMGVTVHFVNPEMDAGRIISQRSFQVEDTDTIETVTEKIHQIEHEIYPETLKMWEEI